MSHLDDPNFWGQLPASQKIMRAQAQAIGLDVSSFVMGDPNDKNAPTVLALKMEPGAVIVRHGHPCERFEIVVRGSLHVGDKVLKPGDIMRATKNEIYGPHTAGPEGCVTFEIFSTQEGFYMTTYETEEGTVLVDMSSGAPVPRDAIGYRE